MKATRIFVIAAIAGAMLTGCKKDNGDDPLIEVVVFMQWVKQESYYDWFNICAMTPDGQRKVTLLTYDALSSQHFGYCQPQLSPDGSRLLVNNSAPEPNWQHIMEYNLASKEMRDIYSVDNGNVTTPVYHPGGSKIAFSHQNIDEKNFIFTINTDGTGLVSYGNLDGNYRLANPGYTPDGNTLILTSHPNATDRFISTMKADGNGYRRIIETKDDRFFHAIAISNTQLMYVWADDWYAKKSAIYVANISGVGEPVKVYEADGQIAQPTLNKAGNRISFMVLKQDNNNKNKYADGRFYSGAFNGSKVTGVAEIIFKARVNSPRYGVIRKSLFDNAPVMKDVAP